MPRRNRGSRTLFVPRPAQLAAASCAGLGTAGKSGRPHNGGAKQAAENSSNAVILSAAKDPVVRKRMNTSELWGFFPKERAQNDSAMSFSAACKAHPFQHGGEKCGLAPGQDVHTIDSHQPAALYRR